MILSRYLYAAALGLCFFCYLAWGQWLSWVLLWVLLMVPWLSLALSLPAITRFRAQPACPPRIQAGSWGQLSLLGSCTYPVPPFRGRLRVHNLLTGQQRLYRPEEGLPTRHCGGCRVTVEKGRVCDYLGLFSFPIRSCSDGFFLVLPQPIPTDTPADMLPSPEQKCQEPLPYRPGEPIRRIHRKLTIKTDSLILLQPAPHHPRAALTLELTGSADALDRQLGEFFWLGRELTKKSIPFLLQVHTGEGWLALSVGNPPELDRAMSRLLCASPVPPGGDHG